ncbi:MAG: hypothetical protein Q4C26_07715 [Bacteroidales bacterium]|nr:hypothetical protein [Bacteroidales bacterium]
MSSKTEQRLNKKRLVVSYANMSPELAAAFKEKYPRGYSDYMGDIFKVDKPNGTFFYAISLEIPEAIYLIKIDVKIDDYEDVEKDIFGDNSEDESETGENNTFSDDEGNPAFAGEDDSDE